MKIALFDIDGTLVWTHGAGRRAMQRALSEVAGSTVPADHRYDGKTDRQIVREAMRHDGVDDVAIDTQMEDMLGRYLLHLEGELDRPDHGVECLPGVHALLDAIEAREEHFILSICWRVARCDASPR